MHNRKLEEGIGGVMGISMNDLTAQKKLEKVNLIKRIITMVFGVGSVVMFFLPYAQFVFKDTKYVTSGLDFLCFEAAHILLYSSVWLLYDFVFS